MSMSKEMPEQDELVLATVKKILPYGAFCSLDEYNNREAFLHISEVAPRWIKNIREFLREGQHLVARVYKFVPEKNQIDLSLKRVTASDKKAKMEGAKREKRGSMLLLVAAKRMKVKKPEMDAVGAILVRKWGEIYSAFEAVSEQGEKALEGLEISDKWRQTLFEISTENIKKQRARAEIILTLRSNAENGLEVIRGALLAAKPVGANNEMKITYMGAPKYALSIIADDFKTANKEAEKIADIICGTVRHAKGEATYELVENT